MTVGDIEAVIAVGTSRNPMSRIVLYGECRNYSLDAVEELLSVNLLLPEPLFMHTWLGTTRMTRFNSLANLALPDERRNALWDGECARLGLPKLKISRDLDFLRGFTDHFRSREPQLPHYIGPTDEGYAESAASRDLAYLAALALFRKASYMDLRLPYFLAQLPDRWFEWILWSPMAQAQKDSLKSLRQQDQQRGNMSREWLNPGEQRFLAEFLESADPGANIIQFPSI